MGVEMEKVTLKWDAETLDCDRRLLARFAPFAENRSQLSRIVYKLFDKFISMHGTVAILDPQWQDSLRKTSSDVELKNEFPSLASAAPGKGARSVAKKGVRPYVIRPTSQAVDVEQGMEAWGPSFLGNFRRAFAGESTMRRLA